MRASRRRWLGGLALGSWVALLVVVTVSTLDEHDRVERPSPDTVVDRFVDAWERSRLATYVAVGTFERHSEVTGASIASEDVVAQDPPRRLHRQLGGIEGRVDDRLLVCPSAPGPGAPTCRLGDPGGPTYAEDVATEVAGLRSLLTGDAPVYRLRDDGHGCYALTQEAAAVPAPFGVRARYCFDDATGALRSADVAYEGGIEEQLDVRTIRADVTDADLEP